LPNVAVMLAQASVGLIETWFVGRLGTDALVLHSVGGWRWA
jgi:Na+-driven multidrug efflux pump